MKLDGTFTVRSPREKAWAFFLDPKALSVAIDDPHTIEVVDRDNFKGTIKAGVAFIKGTFTWSAAVKERTEWERARIQVHGSGMGSAFDIDSTIEMSEAAGQTTVRWAADVVLNGTVASMGARLLQGTIDKKTNAFFENARKHLEGA
ncbi:MAG TPA: carbon monoxide dehydrogenase subunit G [Thermoplasmata archaeon]